MGKGKLAKFADMASYPHVFEYPHSVAEQVPFEMKGHWREQFFKNDNPIVLELGCGLLVNRDYGVWDYRHLPLNFQGQICLPYTLLWIPVSLAAILLYDWLDGAVLRLTFGEDHVK